MIMETTASINTTGRQMIVEPFYFVEHTRQSLHKFAIFWGLRRDKNIDVIKRLWRKPVLCRGQRQRSGKRADKSIGY